jgi:hypothetical protein
MIVYVHFYEPGGNTTIKLHWRRTLVHFIFMEQIINSIIYPLRSKTTKLNKRIIQPLEC